MCRWSGEEFRVEQRNGDPICSEQRSRAWMCRRPIDGSWTPTNDDLLYIDLLLTTIDLSRNIKIILYFYNITHPMVSKDNQTVDRRLNLLLAADPLVKKLR